MQSVNLATTQLQSSLGSLKANIQSNIQINSKLDGKSAQWQHAYSLQQPSLKPVRKAESLRHSRVASGWEPPKSQENVISESRLCPEKALFWGPDRWHCLRVYHLKITMMMLVYHFKIIRIKCRWQEKDVVQQFKQLTMYKSETINCMQVYGYA